MVKIEALRPFSVSLEEAFDYITEQRNWPDYWPGLVRVERGSRWRVPGDRARLVMRLLGREVELELLLTRFEPRRLVQYTSVQRGFPDARHERRFEAAGGGVVYEIAVEYEPRGGLRGVFDRVIFRRAVERALRETLVNLAARLEPGPHV